jgi:hypothetical protein
VTLKAASSGAKVFNLDAGGVNTDIDVKNCAISSCSNIGTIKGFGGDVLFDMNEFSGNTTGLTLQNDVHVTLLNELWDSSNHGTYFTFTGTFNTIQIIGGYINALSSNSATGIDVSGITSLTTGELKTVMFSGTGTYTNGTFSNAWAVECMGLTTQKDDVANGLLYISTTAATTLSGTAVPTKVAGTTTAPTLFRVSSPANNRLTYAGTKTRTFQVIVSLSVTTSGGDNTLLSFYIAKNGTVSGQGEQNVKLNNSSDQQNVTVSDVITMATGDYVEVWGENNYSSSSFTVQKMVMVIK